MNMKNIKINSQTRSNFLLSNAMFMPGFYDRLEEIGRNWINSLIIPYDFYFYGLDKINEINNKSLHKKKIDNAPNKDLRLKQAINKCFDEFIKKDGQDALNGLNKELREFASTYGLGSEIVEPLSILLVAGYWDPPKRPFFISPLEDCLKNNKIVLEIGPQTTCKDIVENWEEIENIRKKLWPKNVVHRVTERKIKSRGLGFLALINKKGNAGDLVRKLWDDENDWGQISAKLDKQRAGRIRVAKNRFIKKLKA